MDQDQRDALRERNRRRANCSRCGGHVQYIDGKNLDRIAHFVGIIYKLCGACGHSEATKRKKASR